MADGPRKFTRSASDKKIAGVCGGFARYFNIDPTLVRVLWVAVTIVSFGLGVIAYILLWAFAPEQ
jgi:phage shock protein PspC (stress-responsive transcriptional regulator)